MFVSRVRGPLRGAIVYGLIPSERIHRQTPMAGLSADYALDDRQPMNASVSWTQHGGHRTYTPFDESTGSNTVTDSTERLSSGHDPETDSEERLGFAQKLARLPRRMQGLETR